MELLEDEITIDYNNKTIKVLFDGILKEGFVIESDFDYDENQTDFEDSRTGQRDYFIAENITFWDFKIYDASKNEININDRELKKIKELVEFKLIYLLETYLNEK